MKKLVIFLAFICLCILLNAQPKKRVDSFFGIHFDFHASDNDKEIGKTFTAEMIDSFLTIVKPDYVQVDCKGHAGYTSFPTKVGNQTGGYTKDILKVWREVTAKHNVALYVHYSGIMDVRALQVKPEWGLMLPDGSFDKGNVSYLGDYSEKLLIPQLKEVSDYGVDGAWIDGDCWATNLDYSPEVLELFKKETGITNVPKLNTDPNYKEFVEFNRTMFRKFLSNYIDAIHKYNPNFQITSNWAYSSLMPEPVDVNVDFLSGDVSGQNCVYNSGFQARCLALQGKPWDLMAWGFTKGYDPLGGFGAPKSLVQLEQEAAEVMALGGGFQAYWTQNRDGSLKPWYFGLMGELGKFCKARQPFCKDAETIPQIGLWYSTYSTRKQTNKVYGWDVPNVEGNLSLLLDGQNCVDILLDHQLKSRLDKYPVIIIPEFTGLKDDLKMLVLEYVKNGGNLIVIGAKGVKEFEPQLGVTFEGYKENKIISMGFDNQISSAKTNVQFVKPLSGTKVIGGLYKTDDLWFPSGYPVATVVAYGKGKIAGFYIDAAKVYYTYQARGYLKIMNAVINEVFPTPVVQVSGSDYVHTVVSQKDGKWFVNLINAAGSHFNAKVYEYDHIPATGDLTLELYTPKPIKRIVLQPEGKALKFSEKDGKATVVVPSVAIHSIVQLEF